VSNHLLGWLLLIPAALWTGACVNYISIIGKPREPVPGNRAGFDVLFNAAAIAVVVIAAVRLI
jgi:hypothetical protein